MQAAICLNVDGNKGRVTAYGCIGAGIAMILMRFTSPIGSPVLFYALCAISKFFEGVLASGIYGVIPDTVEYGQLKTGVRNDGFLSAFISLGNKFGIALGSAGSFGVPSECDADSFGQRHHQQFLYCNSRNLVCSVRNCLLVLQN